MDSRTIRKRGKCFTPNLSPPIEKRNSSPPFSIDLNADLGEGAGTGRRAEDEMLLCLVTSANIACGYHAGDEVTIRDTVRLALDLGVTIGAHPSFPDRIGFGRREMKIRDAELRRHITKQVEILAEACVTAGAALKYVKPHGALYNLATRDRAAAEVIAASICDVDKNLVLLGLAGNLMLDAARDAGLAVAAEAFADRSYESDGTLTPRSDPRALLDDPQEIAARMIRMITANELRSADGAALEIRADSICTHGDGPNALKILKQLRGELETAGIAIASFA